MKLATTLLILAFGTSVLAEQPAAPKTMSCRLTIFSAIGDGDTPETKKETVQDFSVALVTTPKGIQVATPVQLLTNEELAKFVLGTGPLATQVKNSSMTFMGLFMSKNSQGNQLNNSTITTHTNGGQQSVTAIGLNQERSQVNYSLENDEETHTFSLACETK